MPIRTKRRIIAVGGSKSVSLPPCWLDAADLDLGDEVTMVADGVVLIAVKGTRIDAKHLAPLVQIINRGASK